MGREAPAATPPEEIARAFVEARRTGRALSRYPGALPRGLDEAYRIQDLAIEANGRAIGGWKVGRIPDAQIESLGSNRLAGPILAPTIVPAGETPPVMRIFEGGFGAAEAEFLLRIDHVPEPGRTEFTIEDILPLIGAVHVGIEVASSPFAGINQFGAPVTISDFGNNNGLVVGQPIADWRTGRFQDWPVELRIDGDVAGADRAANMLDGVFGAARFLFALLATRGQRIKAGQWISSGAVTGVHGVRPGSLVEARFGDALSVSCRIDVVMPGIA